MSEPTITILCVAHEVGGRELRKLILMKQGYRVLTAASGAEALTLLAAGGIDLVISDQMMPEMNGTELARLVRATWPSLPFVLVSGANDMPRDADLADRFVSKTAGPEALFASIRELVPQQQETNGVNQ